MKAEISLAIIVLLSLSLIPKLAHSEEGFDQYREQIIGWVENSGVLLPDNKVVEGVFWDGSKWTLSTKYGSLANRTDAEFEVALAFLYEYEITNNVLYRDKALDLLREGRNESIFAGRYPAIPTSTSDSKSVFTQDNGKAMVVLAKAVELTNDTELRAFLIESTDWWSTKITSDGRVGVGIDAIILGDHLTPPIGVCARATTSLLIGFTRAYQVVGKTEMKDTAVRLGEWLINNRQADHFSCPSISECHNESEYVEYTLKNGGVGNVVETNSLGLRAMILLWNITGDGRYRNVANAIYGWIKNQIDQTYARWGYKVPSEVHREPNYSIFNTLYMFTPSALIDYAKLTGLSEPMIYAQDILSFMCTVMTIHGSSICDGGIVGEWDFSIDNRSSFVDNETMIWGNWIYTGWSNTPALEALGKLQVNDCYVAPQPPIIPDDNDTFIYDVNQDGKIDVKDVYATAKSFGSDATSPIWNILCDFNQDGQVDIKDYYQVCKHYGYIVT